MNRLILANILAIVFFYSFQQISFAVCVEDPPDTFTCNINPPNPDPTGVQGETNDNNLIVNLLPGSIIDTRSENSGNGGDAIVLGNGNNVITATSAEIFGALDAIRTGDGNNLLNVTGSSLETEGVNERAVLTGNGDDSINILNSDLSSFSITISSGQGKDTIVVEGSNLFSEANDVINPSGGDDEVVIINSRLTTTNNIVVIKPTVIDLFGGNDTVKLGSGAELIGGIIRCNDSTNDTIIFAMDVPDDRLSFISAELATKDPAGDSITINGLFYEWEECTFLVNELVGVQVTRPVPMLSQWGLIAMAGILGLVGFIAIRKKYVAG